MLSKQNLESEIHCEMCNTEADFSGWLSLKNIIHPIEQ